MSEDRKMVLLALAAILAAVRFVLWPWLDAQGAARDELRVLTQRLDRSLGVIQNRQSIVRSEAALAKNVADARKIFPEFSSADVFKLETQQQVAALVSGAGLTVSSFAWIVEGKAPSGVLAYGRARLQIGGELGKLASVHGELETRFPGLRIREINMLGEGPIGNPASASANLNVVFDAFYRETRAGAP